MHPDTTFVAPGTSAFRYLLGYIRRRPWQFALLLAIIVSAGACAIGVQLGMKLIVDSMAGGDRESADVWRWIGLFICLIAIESALWRAAGWLGCGVVVATGVDLRLDLFRQLSSHPMRYFSEHGSGALGARVTATAGATGAVLGTLTWQIVPPCIDFIGAVVVLIHIHPLMSAALVAFAVAVGLLIAAVGGRGRSLNQDYARKGAEAGGQLIDVLMNMWSVKAFSARDREFERLRKALGEEGDAQRRSWRYMEKTRVLHDVCLWLMAGGMLAWAVHSWRIGTSTPGDVVLISSLTFRILHGSRDLALSLVAAAQQLGVITETLRTLDAPRPVLDRPGAPKFVRRDGTVRFEDVSFAYGEHPVLERFSLDIPAGQRVGIVGPSGAGKSTLITLIQRLDDVGSGVLCVDGQVVSDVTQESLRAAVAVVPQDITLLNRSIRDNIRLGRPDASDEDVQRAARNAHCDFIESFPEGYDTLVGERGTRLSGGQRQRVSIARAFLKDSHLLLLDEATSALDSVSEDEISRALESLMRGRTVIAASHRLATVAAFDRVIVLQAGRIVEDGPPASLLAQGGLYERLWRLQTTAASVA